MVGAALITATVLTFVSSHTPDQTVTAFSQLTAQHSVSPNQVITVAFNQPMNEDAVEAGVHIQPAIKVSFSWKNNDLVISPAYHLSANTPYTVTIAKTAIRASSGALAVAPINITFGTAPTPTPGPTVTAPPSLSPGVWSGSKTEPAMARCSTRRTGHSVSTVGLAPGVGDYTSQSPTATAPAPTPDGEPDADTRRHDHANSRGAGIARRIPRNRQLQRSSDRCRPSAAAHSRPHGGRATSQRAVDNGNWRLERIVVTRSDGTQTREAWSIPPTPVTALTWATNDRIIYTDRHHRSRQLIVSKAEGQHAVHAYRCRARSSRSPSVGAYAYVSPAAGTGGALLNINTGTAQVLTGAVVTSPSAATAQ